MAAAKVVRVEDVVEGLSSSQLIASSAILLNRTANQDESAERKTSAEFFFKGSDSCESGITEITAFGDLEANEALEKVYPLPENWPQIKQLQRPMSCALSMSRMPCVHKAVSHLELIQNIMDEWFKRKVEEVKSQSSTRCTSSESIQVATKKHLRFRNLSTCSTMGTGASSISRASSATLLVTGLGVDTPELLGKEETVESMGLEIPYLGAEDVIDEVITLLARLETDRQDTQHLFQQEVDTAVTLKKKIDDLCLRRLRELPELVQREHEACIVDLNELYWHLAYTTRNQVKSQQRKDNAELMNNRLREDIEFVKMHIPLVEEKLVLELQAMDRIKKAQVETNQELMTTKQRQAKTEQKSTEALLKAETERGHIRRELNNVQDHLTQISEELSTAKMTFNSYVHQVTDIGHQLTDNAQELEVLAVKDENAKAAEEMLATKVRSLQSKIADAEFEYRRLENENIQAEEQLKIMTSRNSACLEDLQQKSKVLEEKLRVIQRHNAELTMEIEDTQEKINKCEQQKIADEKNIRRIHRELERVASMMVATTEEHNSVSIINHHIRDQLHTDQEKVFRTEESLKNTAETLRRQVKEEMRIRTVLEARITTDTAEIDKTRLESGKKKEKADKVADDVQSAVTVVLEKVEKLRTAKAKQEERKVALATQIEDTEKQYEESLQSFMGRLSTITPHYAHLQGCLDDLLRQESELRLILRTTLDEAKALKKKEDNKLFVKICGTDETDGTDGTDEKAEQLIVHISASKDDSLLEKAKFKFPGLRLRKAITDEDLTEAPKPSGVPSVIVRLRNEVSNLNKILDHMEWKTGLMNKNIEEMDGAQAMMNKVYAKTEAAVTELTGELEELKKQLESANKIGEDLKSHVIAVNDRLRDGEVRHSRILQDRCAVLLRQDEDKLSELKKNKDLASRYRQLQNEFLVKKEQLLRTFDDRLKMEATINDVKQLKSLQSKMHGALTEYFKLSGLYNESQLTKLEQTSAENGQRVGQLQEDMEEALGLITSFLQTEMDGTRTRQMAWEAMQKMEEHRKQSLVGGTNGAPVVLAS